MSKTILITGASSGIGEAACFELLRRGHKVHACARRVEKMQPLEKAGATIHFLDVTDETSMNEVVESVGPVDVLINNAGFGLYGAVEDVTIDEARKQFEVNLFGLARMTQLVTPGMRERGSGLIMNISSMGGKVFTPLGAWYHASKHALEGWSDCLRIELAPFDIDVAIVEPGAIETEFCEQLIPPLLERSKSGSYEELAEKMAEATRRTYAGGKTTPASKTGKVLADIVDSKRRKTRYVTGYLAKPIIMMRRLMPDRLFDWIIRKFM
ncbi:MAG: short-chain dehydrogenase/reductase [Verrucomicrobiales bacterium]|nr:short-chain dehydrogenase/reductase [Verrucomicrobiales bacterium]